MDIRDQEKSDRALAEREQRYRTLIECSPDGIAIHQDGRIVFVNQQAITALRARSADELIGLPIEKILHPDEVAPAMQAIADLRAGKPVAYPRPSRFLRFDGTVLPVEVVAKIIDYEGRPANFIIVRDISCRVGAKEAVRQSQAKYQDLYDNAPDMYLSVSAIDGTILECNRTLEAMTGYSKQELVGKPVFELYAPDCRDEARRAFQIWTTTGEVNRVELSIQCKNGSRRYVELHANGVRDESGTVQYSRSIWRDITARKEAEEKLRASEAKYRQLVETIPQKIFVKDRNSVYVSCNENYARDLGISPSAIAGKTDFDFFPAELAKQYRADDERIMRTGATEDIEERYDQGGKTSWIYTIKTPVRDAAGKTTGVLGVFSDITARKDAERALAKSELTLKLFVEYAPAAIAMFDTQMRYLAASRRWFEYYRIRDQSVIGKSHNDVFPEMPKRWKEVYQRCLAGAVEGCEEEKFPRADGTIDWVRWEALPWRYDSGEIGGIIIFTEVFTELKTAKDLVRQSEERLRLALEAAQMGTFDWDIPRNKVEWSRGHEVLFGYKPGEFGGNYAAFAERVHPEDLKRINEEVARCIQGMRPFASEFRVIWPDQSIHWIAGKGEFTFDGAGNPVRMLGVVREITDRKLAEARAVKNFELLEEAQRLARLGSWELEFESGQNFWSAEMYQIFGVENFGTKLVLDDTILFVHPDDRERFLRYLDAIRADGRERSDEFRIMRPDGAVRWIRAHSHGVPEPDGRITRIMGTVQDVHDAKLAAERQALLESALKASPDAVFITDREGTITWANAAFETQSGYPAAWAIGKNPRFLKSGHQPPEFYENFWNTILSGKPLREIIVNRRKSGDVYTIETSITPVTDGQGNITHFVAIQKDITERLVLEEQMRQSQKLEAIGTLAGGIAHDFNNILSAIIGYSELALEQIPTGTESHRDIDRVLAAGQRAKELVRQILTFSRQSEAGLARVEPYLIVNEAGHLLRATLPTTAELRVSVEKTDHVVNCDATRIHQIVLNLCTNAFHALRAEKGFIEVECRHINAEKPIVGRTTTVPPGEYILISVRDNGSGMSDDVMERIFEPFFTTKALGRGTGLGLSTVRGIVEQAHGAICVQSKPGEGSCFEVYLPCAEPVEHTEAANSVPQHGAGQRVIVVDDEHGICEVHRRVVEHLGYRPEAVPTPLDALALFRKDPQQFDIILTDQTMPGMTGLELARELWKIRPDFPVILCSGRALTQEESAIGDQHRFAAIQKPIDRGTLAAALSTLLVRAPHA